MSERERERQRGRGREREITFFPQLEPIKPFQSDLIVLVIYNYLPNSLTVRCYVVTVVNHTT